MLGVGILNGTRGSPLGTHMKEPARDLPGVNADIVYVVSQDLGLTLSSLFISPAAFEMECGVWIPLHS